MSAEKKFWSNLMGSMSPGWDINVNSIGSDGPNMSAQTVFIYVVDTQSGWIGAGSMEPRHLEMMHDDLSENKDKAMAVLSSAAPIILSHSSSNPDKKSAEHMDCILAAACALTLTGTYKQVQPQGLDGHWMYVVYKLNSGNTMGRPVFFRNGQKSFFDSDSLDGVIFQVLKSDLHGDSMVNQKMKQGGGALLHPRFNFSS